MLSLVISYHELVLDQICNVEVVTEGKLTLCKINYF